MAVNLAKKLLALNDVESIEDLDAHATYEIHRRIILSKPFLQRIYRFYFDELLKDFGPLYSKNIVEIGAGAYNSKEFFKEVITSDIEINDFVEMAVDAHNMPFNDEELDGLILLETLHHLKDPGLFFSEASRTLKRGGLLVMIEPYFSPWGNIVYRKLHHEPVIDSDDWGLPETSQGRLTGANLIMPYNIFIKQRKCFEERYPNLSIVRISPHTCFTYGLSGGLSYRCLVPRFLESAVWSFERALKPLYRLLAMNMTVVLEKV